MIRCTITRILLLALVMAVHAAEENVEEEAEMLPVARAIRQISFPGASQGLFAGFCWSGKRWWGTGGTAKKIMLLLHRQ